MAQSKEWKQGYEDAIAQLKKMLSGQSGQNQQNGQQGTGQQGSGQQGTGNSGDKQNNVGSDGSPMQTPQLNANDQKEAAKNSKNGSGKGQAGEKERKEAGEATGSCGGMVSQSAGSAIAKSEGYDDESCKEMSQSAVSQMWKDATIEACNKDNSPGMGSLISHFKDYYITSHDWKNELKKYVGHALSNIENDRVWGKKKWLAQDELKKYDKQSEGDLDTVMFLIDCSGSVSDKLLQNIISECWTICRKKGVKKVTYCYYDDGIRQMETNDTLKSDGIISKEMTSKIHSASMRPSGDIHGRGGNREDLVMKQVIDMLKKSRKKLELIMWFTDGYTNQIPARPKMFIKNMIWVVYDNNDFKASDDSKVIHIKSEDLGK